MDRSTYPDEPDTRSSMTDATDRTTRRGSLVAPVVVGGAGLATLIALLLLVPPDDTNGTGSTGNTGNTGDATTSTAVETTTTDVEVETTDTGDVTTEPPATETSSTESPSTGSGVPIDDGPVRTDTARIDGTTFVQTGACVASPISNPDVGIGSAHVTVSLHRLESAEGDRVIVEQWRLDDFESIALSEPGGRYGQTAETEVTGPVDEVRTSIVPMDDGSSVTVEHDLRGGGIACAPTIVSDATDEFAFDAFGLIDSCRATDASGLGTIMTFQGGSMLHFADSALGETVAGAIRLFDDDRSMIRSNFGASRETDPDYFIRLDGVVSPGYLGDDGADDEIRLRADNSISTTTCLSAQEAAFAQGGGSEG